MCVLHIRLFSYKVSESITSYTFTPCVC